ncbi:MAG: flippase [Thermoleophilia bacterium]|jgi:O-antigen/teichoic acid export membrane protein
MPSQTVDKSSGSSRVPLNAALLSSSQFVRAAIGFVFFLFLARRLGPEDFGRYMFAFALSEIFSILGDVGLHEYTIREIARKPEQLRERLAGILGLKTLLSCSSAIIMIAIVPLMGKDRPTSMAVVAFALAQIGYSWFYTSTIAFSVKQDLHIQAFLWLFEKVLFATGGVIALLIWHDFVLVALSNTVVQFTGGVLAVWIVWRKYGPFILRIDRGLWPGYLKAALPFGMIVAFYLVYFRVDSVMISFFRGETANVEVGQYASAYNLISALLFIPAGLVAALFPKLAGQFRKPTDNLDGPFQKACRWLLVISMPMAVGGWLLSEKVILFFLKDQYLPATTALAILSWVLPVWFVTFLQGNILTVVERQKAVAGVGFINMVVNVGLNLVFIPPYGFTAAAVTTLITEVLGLVMMFYLLRNNISLLRTLKTALILALLSAVTGVLVWLLRDRIHVLAVIAIAIVVYTAAVLALRIIPMSEIATIFRRGKVVEEDVEEIDLPSSGP